MSASWGDPQNPLEPANTNEVQGGKVLDMIFRGLKRYNPKTGEAENMLAETIDDHGLSRTSPSPLKNGWTFTNGETVTAKSFVDAWNYGASLKNKQMNAYFFELHRRLRRGPPGHGASPPPKTLSGLKVTDDRPSPSGSTRSSPPGPTPSATPPSRRCRRRSSPTTRPG